MKKKSFVLLHLKNYKGDLCIYLFFAFLAWGINFLLPYLTGSYIDVLIKSDRNAVFSFTLILFSLNVISLIISYIYQKSLSKLNTNIAFRISFTLYERLKKVYMSFYNNTDTVYLVNRINNDSNALIAFFTSNAVSLVTQSLALILGLAILVHINRMITLVTILAVPVYVILYNVFRKKLYNANYNFMEQRSEYFAKMTEQFSFIKFIKIHSLYDQFAKRLYESYDTLFSSLMKYFRVNYIFINTSSFVMSLVSAFTFFYGGLSVINGRISIGQYAIINVYFNIIMQALKYFLEFGKNYQEVLVSFNRLMELYEIDLEDNGEILIKDIFCIRVEHLTFSYRPNLEKIFEDFNGAFNKGNVYILIGKNGAGKSTFVNILLGLYNDLYTGKILFDNHDLKTLNMYDLRKNLIAVTEQEPIFFNTGINESTMVISQNKRDKLKEYCSKFDIEYPIEISYNSTEKNINTNFSGGEKQKLSIIRTLMKDTPIMIFDEPSSALDKGSTETFKSFLTAIKKDKIIIIITHDDKLLDISDCIIDFD